MKKGRPTSETPKKNIVGCKLSDIELDRLEKYCTSHNISKSIILRNGINSIISENKED